MANLGGLNPQQRQAVETIHGPVLILAGAGTGKTRVITTRIAHLIASGIPAGRILAVTFTNKAAREMRERLSRLMPRRPQSRDPAAAPEASTICTFHSLCARILREHIEKLGYKRNFVIYDEADQLSTVKKILARISSRAKALDAGGVLSLLSRLKNAGARGIGFADPDLLGMAQHIRPGYQAALKARNAVDFDDLILLVLRLFAGHPDALEACRAKYRFVMVDEYQDTNASQFQLVRALTLEHRNLCVVGDDDQSIYGWRGAEISNLLDMEKFFPEVKIIKLEQNYRSTNTILRAANAVIQRNVQRRGKKLWSENGDGSRIVLYQYRSDEEEARSLADLIRFSTIAQRSAGADHAILFRTNAQSRAIETALRQADIRYRLIGGQSYFDRREIRDFLSYLKTFVNPDDDVSLLRIANVPARGLSDATMERLLAASQERACSVFTAMRNPVLTAGFQARTREAIEAFVRLVEDEQRALRDPARARDPGGLGRWANDLLERLGYCLELRRLEKNPEAADNRVQNLKELFPLLDGEATGEPRSLMGRLERFLENVTLDGDREADGADAGADAVTLITMHSCKGLEFPHVYVAGLEDGLLPHSRAQEENTLDEERRLFYVAITRAMKSLTLSHCAGRRKYGQLVSCRPSPFLAELPAELVEHASEKAKQPVGVDAGKRMFSTLRASLDLG